MLMAENSVLKALFKPLLTKLKHLACGAHVPMFSSARGWQAPRLWGRKAKPAGPSQSPWPLWLYSVLCLLLGSGAEEENHFLEHVFILETFC